jgi:putative methionine-R-sulfoxide reductase with GAF domain
MSVHTTLDRESFQNLLASAFVVQESLMDAQSGSGIVELLHLVMAGELDVNDATHLIADRARNVANASGVAIGLLKGDQLVYRAGSGSASTLVGRHVMATLSVSANADARHEILRVEDAQTDPGIGAAICCQFGVRSLLILPIYHNRAVAGVLEVFFTDAHAFQHREICTYQLMARVVGEAMAYAVLFEQKKAILAERSKVPQAFEQTDDHKQSFRSNSGLPANTHAVHPTCRAPIVEAEGLSSRKARHAGAGVTQPARFVPSHMGLWRIADWAAVVTVLVTASWIAYSYRRPASPSGALTRQRWNVPGQQAPFMPQEPVPAELDLSKPQTPSVAIEPVRKVARRTYRTVRVGDNEIDYISDDVTVRRFFPRPALQQVRGPDYQVEYISEDVTVRHFKPKRAIVSPIHPVDRSAGSDRSRQ